MQASATVWSAEDWYDTFVGCQEITHVLAYYTLAESLLDALELTIDSGTDDDDDDDVSSSSSEGNGVPFFRELVSLTLVGVDFMRANETASITLFNAMELRQTSPSCVTTLDRLGCVRALSRMMMLTLCGQLSMQCDTECNTNVDPWIATTPH